ncbi:MAG TPA: Calx-beta domain-containing protein, partial [Gemmataceae bacterium]|nr:Calx-beta domain-containing protein [Gemmataceae bacterium]
MAQQWFRRLLARTFPPAPRTSRRRPSFHPTLEVLEGRTLPATFIVTNIDNGGIGSLRQAIIEANGNPGPDRIEFNIPGGGVQVISIVSGNPLPGLTDEVVIDGTTQPGFSGTPLIRIDGGGVDAPGISISTNRSTVRALIITRFIGSGITINGNNNTIEGCLIGTNIAGASGLGNVGAGITINGSNNTIGGTQPSQGNTIAFNGGAGVAVNSGTGNAIRGNAIHSNGGLGIDLGPAGVAANDPGDPDTGANNLQNYPVLTRAFNQDGSTFINLTFNSTPNQTFNIDFYTSPSRDPSGFGEGATPIGSLPVSTNANGDGLLSGVQFTPELPAGIYITATATDAGNNTSEFSNAVLLPTELLQFTAGNYTVDENAGPATVTVFRTGSTGSTVTVRYASRDDTARAGEDYSAVSGTLTFTAGQLFASFTVPIIDDAVFEGNETVRLTLSEPSGTAGLGTPSEATLTIRDNDTPQSGQLGFAASAINWAENGGKATITVTRTSGSDGVVTVQYATTTGGTATPGVASPPGPSLDSLGDYFPTSGTLTFAHRQTAATFTINLIEDATLDPNETVLLALSAPTGGATLGTSTATLTLVDNGGPFGGLDPSPRAQEMLELLNRMRLNPQAELNLILGANDPDVNRAIGPPPAGFQVDLQRLAQQWATLVPAPPLAWHQALQRAALYHTLQMLAHDQQSHQLPGEPDLGQRLTAAGYNFSTAGENVFAYAFSIFYGHAGFAIDWGNGPGGIQDPPGHRNSMMNSAFREVGIGVIDGLPGKQTGPLLITQDFGNRFSLGNPYLMGVVFNDANNSRYYEAGEGLAGVNVSITGPGGTVNTTTMSAGGYQQQLAPGTYTVTFSGGGLPAPVMRTVTLTAQNAKLDVVVGQEPGQFRLGAAAYSIDEEAGPATVTVTRIGGSAGIATVVFTTSGGSATAGQDYTPVTQTLIFGASETSKTVTIPIISDTLTELNETVNLTLSAPTGGATLSTPSTAVLTILDNDLRVDSVRGENTGFFAQFSGAIDPAVLNLYDSQAAGLGPADVTVVGNATGPVRGTLVIDSSRRSITFIKTGGLLAPDTYTVTFRSGSDGFKGAGGGPLDGNANGLGTPGGNHVVTFTITSVPAAVVSVPDFARGPDQAVNVPADSSGLPLRLTSAGGVRTISLRVVHSTSLLSITGATVAPGLPPGATVTFDNSVSGQPLIMFSSPTALPAGTIDFVRLSASVPTGAASSYATKQVISLTAVTINDVVAPGAGDSGVQVIAYLGDTTGNGGYSSADALRGLRVGVGLDSGFEAYQLADPVILADLTGNGTINAADGTRLLQEALGIDRPEVPPLPTNPPNLTLLGPDPLLSIPSPLSPSDGERGEGFRGRRGRTITVPVNLDVSEGLNSADLALSYDV